GVPEPSLTLTASLRPAALDARRGVVRLHPELFAALGLRPAAPVSLTRGRASPGVAAAADQGASRALHLAAALHLGNPCVRAGAQSPTATEAAPPTLEDLPGLRNQAHELTELLDLGFHHGEVLSRLGTTVSLGVLITGPAGSGKSALVRAVAATMQTRVVRLW